MVDSMIKLFPEDALDFRSNGIGYLPDATFCEVVEKRNDSFELTMKYPITGKRYSEITHQRILVAKPTPYDAPQAFRIYDISKPFNGIVTFNAEHISYDLSGIPVNPFESNTLPEALSNIKKKTISNISQPFTFWTDVDVNNYFKMDTPNSIKSAIGGLDPSLLDIYGGECEFDNFNVRIYKNRGKDRGYSIRYGKNLTDLTYEESFSNIYSAVYPYWYSDDNGFVTANPATIKVSGSKSGLEKIYILDCSSDFTDPPTSAQLVDLAEKYIKDNNLANPNVSLTVSFIALSKTKEYEMLKILDKVKLCDIVEVEFEKLKITTKLKCVETVYNVLTDRYESISLGTPKTTLAKTIVKNKDMASSDLDKSNGNLNTIIKNETKRWNLNLHDYQESTEYAIEQTRSGLHNEIVTTATTIRTEFSTSIDITAQGIRADIKETKDTLETRITNEIDDQNKKVEKVTKEIKEDYSASIDATARGIRADIKETKDTLETRITNEIDDQNKKVEKVTKEIKEDYSASIDATARGIRTEISTTKTELVNDIVTSKEELQTSIEATAEGIRTEISATKKELTGNIATYKEELQASISTTAEGIRSDVSKTYETKVNADKTYGEIRSSISQTADSLKSTIAATYETKSASKQTYANLQSSISQTAGDIRSEVSANYETKENAETKYGSLSSSISQTAGEIATKVSKDGIISAINQTAEKISISASRIDINGAISANETFSVSEAGYATMTGGTIGPFTINSSRLVGGSSGGYTQLGVAGSGYAFAAGTNVSSSGPQGVTITKNVYIGHNGYIFTSHDIDAEGYVAGNKIVVRSYHNGGSNNYNGIILDVSGTAEFYSSNSYRGRVKTFNDALEVLSNKDLALHSGSSNFIQLYENTKYWGELVANSAKKYKDNILDITEEEGDAITKLRPVGFVYKRDGRSDYGLIADDTYPILPQVVILDQNGDPDGINYIKLIPFIIRKIKNMEERWYNEH